jgi:hypothetical protein
LKKSEWNDHDIEEMIKQLPKLKDDRPPSYIYSKVKNNKKSRSSFKRYIPALVTIAALFIVVLLSPALISQMSQSTEESAMEGARSTDSSGEDKKTEKDTSANDSSTEITKAPKEESQLKMAEENDKSDMDFSALEDSPHERLSIYKDDVAAKEYYTYGLVSDDAVPVPVSVIVSSDNSMNWVEQYEKISKQLPETEWGFKDYFPIKADLSLSDDNEEVLLTLEENHPYSGSNANEYNFYQSLLYSFEDRKIKEIKLKNKDGSSPEFSHLGAISSISLNQTLHHAFYLYSPNSRDRYLVPDSVSRENIKGSIEAMKESQSDLYKSVIPEDLSMSVNEDEDVVNITFSEKVDLDSMDFQSAQEMIEGILLTAKSSGYEQVQFQNVEPEQWNGFTFTKPVETPLSPNKKDIN